MNQTTQSQVNYLKFRHLRNYFTATRILNNFENEVRIILEYRDIELNDFSTNMNTANDELMDYLVNHTIRDEITWRIENINTEQKSKLHYTLSNLIFQVKNKFNNTAIELFKKEPVNESTKLRYYYLTKVQNFYERVVENSFQRIKELVTDEELFSSCVSAYDKYRVK